MVIAWVNSRGKRYKSKDLQGSTKEQFKELYKINDAMTYKSEESCAFVSMAAQTNYHKWLNSIEGFNFTNNLEH